MFNLKKMAAASKAASLRIAKASTKQKQKVLQEMLTCLKEKKEQILEANQKDLLIAESVGLEKNLLDRLSLKNHFEGLLSDLSNVIHLPDPVGEIFEEKKGLCQLKLAKKRIPLGVLGVIYESRPNVTLDVSALAIKSGNAAILRGGKETFYTNQVLVQLIQESLLAADLPKEVIQWISKQERGVLKQMLKLHDFIDLIIPRGGKGLQQFCLEQSKIPVITGGVGVCHLFVDESADLKRSLNVIINAKTQKPTVCNALDTLLVHEKIASFFLPKVFKELGEQGVCFRLDPFCLPFLPKTFQFCQTYQRAEQIDWDQEWLGLVLGIRVVKHLNEALAHICEHSTGHSDGILTETAAHAEKFLKEVDSAAVYVNASTRFTDGSQFGLGAEVAISTQKIHARGPVGLKELTSYKWIIQGQYSIRD